MFYHYYKALDSYHRLNTTNGRLYRENERLTAANDRLKGENDMSTNTAKNTGWLVNSSRSWNMPSGAGSRMPSSAQNLPVRIVALRLRTILPTSAKWLTSAPVQNVRSMMSCFPGMLAT